MKHEQTTVDGNEAAAYIAYKTNEVAAIYPITPSSAMGELADAWSAAGQKNIWGMPVLVKEMQSEGGAAGVVHGSLQTGALTTTFTSSQGLLLMIPNMLKIAGELTSTVFHIAARSLATHALSIFGDHGDVMTARSTGWGMLFGASVQEVMDFALVAQAATLKARVPFMHIFDGFRTSHEVSKIEQLSDEEIREMMDEDLVRAHRARALTPDHPSVRGTAQNPDVFFQSRERANLFYNATPGIVQDTMDKFFAVTGRRYNLFDYTGAPDAERVLVLMGSGCETAEETVHYLVNRGEKVGVVKVRLFRPFSGEHLLAAIPATAHTIAVLDRTKEPGSMGETLYQDVVTAITEGAPIGSRFFHHAPRVIGGRYGLASKEFTPAMVKAVLDEAAKDRPKNHFTVGINDDVTLLSLEYDPTFDTEASDVVRAIFWGLGADGTVSANKSTIKIIGEETPNFAQGYFVYDSKKSGTFTVSHLRFGPRPIHSTYLVRRASFVGVHQFNFVERYDVLAEADTGATVLLNSPHSKDEVWDCLPRSFQEEVIAKSIKLYVINAYSVAKNAGLGNRINTIMQTCFFKLGGILPEEEAAARIKESIKKTYGKRGDAVVNQNYDAVDSTLEHLYRVTVPDRAAGLEFESNSTFAEAPEFVRRVTATLLAGQGDSLPVSAFPVDGTYPSGTAQWEKRNIAQEVPVWESDLCIQCGKCVMVCPHSAIRASVYPESAIAGAPETFKHMPAKWREVTGNCYTIQVAVEDCTGCQLCVEVCPAVEKGNPSHKSLNMRPQLPIRELERANWKFFLDLPDISRQGPIHFNTVKNVQLLAPLFEFSGACAGCGETPYIRLLTQLFGDHSIIANATGCSSIYGGNLPTTPYTFNRQGRGPAWSNSLFEDNAEFGLGMRVALDHQRSYAESLVKRLEGSIGSELAGAILSANQADDTGLAQQRERIAELKTKLAGCDSMEARDLLAVQESLVKKDIWIVGGDGWAYDIGYGGLDHVLASGMDVNILVLDTEVYSNTGGQASKATPLGAVAKFAASGKRTSKKDLGMMAIRYGNVYVAQVAMGASDSQTLKAFLEAEAHPGPSIIIAYGQCIAHGIDMAKGMHHQKLAVDSGYWPLYRYNPASSAEGQNPFHLDSKEPSIPLADYIYTEGRYSSLKRSDPDEARILLQRAEESVAERWQFYKHLAAAG
ncbi:MAG TPA: pyruvate:ferredoxin (flavodoxin) oxidoreductase [Blastocatellia bacterium]|nr:pyruvate:ferredoxin (flavodoxin) oxidoreductase [Blastocatellia bacterium]